MSHQTTLPRRRLLAGALALPVAATAAAVPSIAAAQDAELLELGRQHAVLQARCNGLWDQADIAFKAALAACPARPETLRIRLSDHPISNVDLGARRVGEFMDDRDLAGWRSNEDMAWVLSTRRRAEMLARRAELLAAWDGWWAACERAHVASGRRDIEAQADAEGEALTRLEHRIIDTPAKTAAGWRIKARIARQAQGEPDGTYEDRVIRSLLADLLRDEAA